MQKMETNGTKKWAELIRNLGFPIVIAMLLLFFFAGDWAQVKAQVAENNRILNERTETFYRQTMLLEKICMNTAKTEFQQLACSK